MAGRAKVSTKNAADKPSDPKEPVRPLDWRDILNEEAAWHDYGDFSEWFRQIAPGLNIPNTTQFEQFRSSLDFIREQASCIYFGLEPATGALNAKLNLISLEIDLAATAETRLPSLLAVAKNDDDILERLAGALIVGFAQFVADYQKGGPGLCRCEGVFRDARLSEEHLSESEKRYRREIALLEEKRLLEDPLIQRCADFFVGRSKARFCSDACRFMTFQISKQLKEPGYLAEKQRRYRTKRKDSLG
ncbi:MAG: hypothetical protein SGJ27_11330 [Candidatus Melainabacteria bacterium]|nr:hypothetical protein [Candidatus Melainabacteria bacterium]